jgi:ribosomal protein S18 acetylase RimI-like enzyme
MSFLAVRPALPQDEPFLYDLYFAVRGPEFAQAPIPEEQRVALIAMQFRAQMGAYASMYPNSCYHVVLLDSRPIGRLWVARQENEYHLVDIAIHPDLSNKGIGTALIQRLQADAQKAKLPIHSTVFRFNPGSLRFHQRLGFRIVREDLMYFYMEWRPAPLL